MVEMYCNMSVVGELDMCIFTVDSVQYSKSIGIMSYESTIYTIMHLRKVYQYQSRYIWVNFLCTQEVK